MTDQAALTRSETAISHAFGRAGRKSPEKQLAEMLDRHWQAHKPDIMRTSMAFLDEIRAREPLLTFLINPGVLERRIGEFVRGNHPEIRSAIGRKRAADATAAKVAKRGGLLMTPRAIALREKAQKKGTVPLGTLVPSYEPFSSRSMQETNERKRRGEILVTVKAVIDPRANTLRLASTLPTALRGLRINGLALIDVTKEDALKWCEMRHKEASLVERLCWLVADPLKTLGEQLTPEIVGEMAKETA